MRLTIKREDLLPSKGQEQAIGVRVNEIIVPVTDQAGQMVFDLT